MCCVSLSFCVSLCVELHCIDYYYSLLCIIGKGHAWLLATVAPGNVVMGGVMSSVQPLMPGNTDFQ